MENDRRVFLIDSTTALTLLGLGFFPAGGLAIGSAKSWQQSWFENGKTVKETFAALGVGEPIVDQKGCCSGTRYGGEWCLCWHRY